MDKFPLITVITIVYNGEHHLQQTIDSVRDQNYGNLEYIVIDGGSSDRTLEIIKSNSDIISKWVSEKDRGVSDAFNKGISLAQGDLIGFINADDWYEPGACLAAAHVYEKADVIYGNLQMWKGGVKEYLVEGAHEMLEQEMSINHPTVFVRKYCYEREGGFDLSYKCAMDYDFLLRLKIRDYTFLHVPQTMANMRWDGVSDTKWLTGCKETLLIKNKYLPGKATANKLYYLKHVFAIAAPKFLLKLGLGPVVRFYRSRFSRLRKVYFF
jgi:glycosyltransferase involved in cell wall biosynthesis